MPKRRCSPASAGLGDQIGLQSVREFCRPTPLARKEATKQAPVLRAITPVSGGVLRGAMLPQAMPERRSCASPEGRPERARPHGSPLGRYAVRFPSPQAWNPKAVSLRLITRTTTQGSGRASPGNAMAALPG